MIFPAKVSAYTGNLGIKNELIGCDISDWNSLKQLQNREFDLIIHCAAQSGGYGGLEMPQLDCDWNVKGTLNICELALRTNKPKIVYTSSVAVYGGGDDLKEEGMPSPVSNYGVSEIYRLSFILKDISCMVLNQFHYVFLTHMDRDKI